MATLDTGGEVDFRRDVLLFLSTKSGRYSPPRRKNTVFWRYLPPLFDFATSEPCGCSAPPRMKIGLSMIFCVYQAIFKGVSRVAMSRLIPKTSRAAGAPPGMKPRETEKRSFSLREFQMKFTPSTMCALVHRANYEHRALYRALHGSK
jgi:hypothetical protein